MTCREIVGGFICGPTEVRTLSETPVGVRWCFVCRARVEFIDRVKCDTEPSWYGPWMERTCPRGHADGDLGFGMSREWAEPW